ncbi:hypothetical protein COV11_00790 [Candidatus Woesearchaeota archaeon CG10_big_fil_rev_8_21_14_0_10_30_7]|nr:MAG: hypothetical protein COV11_00790 [Candidatus Woesearchaeota archaeon CG10_big_fil_rev_8_21_14_0_10_30_7]
MLSEGEKKILLVLFKDFSTQYNARSISKQVNMTHEGAFKALKNLEKKGFVISKSFGKATMYKMKYGPLTKKNLELLLLEESELNYARWVDEVKNFNESSILVLFGSVLESKEYKDVDLLVVVSKERYDALIKKIDGKNKLLLKKIHPIIQTINDLKNNIIKKDPVIIDAIKNGIVLKGQEKFVEVLSNVTST